MVFGWNIQRMPCKFFQVHERHGSINPCVYSLLPNKTGATYDHFIQELLQGIPPAANENHPYSILLDFELSAMNALKNLLPSVEITGCFFHLSRKKNAKHGPPRKVLAGSRMSIDH